MRRILGLVLGLMLAVPALAAPSLEQFLSYRHVTGLTASDKADKIAWFEMIKGVRNVWVAEAAQGWKARAVTHYTADDGQELTQLAFAPDGKTLIYVRGGDHDANWAAEGGLQPDPDLSPEQPQVTIWALSLSGGDPRMIAEGDKPDVSVTGRVAYTKGGAIWIASLEGKDKPTKAFFDRGRDGSPVWSPDGAKLAFTSSRDDHGFIGVFTDTKTPLLYLAPSVGIDGNPVWSPDGKRIAFSRTAGHGGAPESPTDYTPRPYALWTADAATGAGALVWQSPNTLDGSLASTGDRLGLRWMADGQLSFIAMLDGWQHLYALPASGGTPKLLTPGKYMVEHVTFTADRKGLLYAAGDDDRRHVFKVALDGSAPVAISSGTGIEFTPAPAGDGVALVSTGPQVPETVALAKSGKLMPIGAPLAYPSEALIVPQLVNYVAADGTHVQGQLFQPKAPGKHPALIFVHGGPRRQMLLGWHYMDYYTHAYAMNQYLASQGFVVLSVNYRLGIGYGRAFEQMAKTGAGGGAEYQDVLAGGKWLQKQSFVDANRIGIWGGSYGGYLTAMALSHNSDVFKAGVDFHGVHDWSLTIAERVPVAKRYEQGDREGWLRTAYEASPVAAIAGWKSPVLLIQGDDDRNVHFSEMVDLARRLDKQGTSYEQLVIPNEIHGFLRWVSWYRADQATAEFLTRKLGK